MRALLLSDEGRELAEKIKGVSLVPIVKNIPYDLEFVKKEFKAGFTPLHNVFFTRFSVNMAERLGEFREYAFKGAVATNTWVLDHLKGLGIEATSVPKGEIQKFLSDLRSPYAVWCSSVEEPPKVGEKGRIFVVHDVVEDEEAFPKLAAKINEGAEYLIFTSPEEVYAWEKLERSYGEAERVWAVAIGKDLAALIQNRTSITKVLIFEGGLNELPRFLKLFGIK